MAPFDLRLFADELAAGAERTLGGGFCRILYLAKGRVTIAAGACVASLGADSAWTGGAASLKAGPEGASLLRCELAASGGARSVETAPVLSRTVTLDPAAAYLIRCDRVEFPPGGVAYTHTHQGPGLRCLVLGRIRIETAGTEHHYAPGEAWFESGPDPVFAAGSDSETTAFIRVMVLPREFLGRSSIRYVRAEDQDKPRRQSYRIYIDTPLTLPGSTP